MEFLIETTTCVDALRGRPSVLKQMKRYSPDEFAISSVTAYELYVGAEKSRAPTAAIAKVKIFIESLHMLVFDEECASIAGKTRAKLEAKGAGIGPYDVLIATQGLAHQLIVVTSNEKEFRRVEGLEVENWRV